MSAHIGMCAGSCFYFATLFVTWARFAQRPVVLFYADGITGTAKSVSVCSPKGRVSPDIADHHFAGHHALWED